MLDRREWILVSLSGVLLSLALPPLPFAPLAWLGLVPLLMVLENQEPRRAALIGWFMGFIHNFGAFHWMAFHVTMPRWLAIVACLLTCVSLAFFTAAVAAGVRYSARWLGRYWAWALLPFWVGAEYLRTFTEFAMPWNVLGYTQVRFLGLIQQADIWGVFGVSAWLVGLNIVAYHAVKAGRTGWRPALNHGALFILAITVVATYGRWRLNELPIRPTNIRIALVQPNVGMEEKWSPEKGLQHTETVLEQQTLKIRRGSVDLVMWPETAIPSYMVYGLSHRDSVRPRRVVSPRYRALMRRVTAHIGVPLVTGTPIYDYATKYAYNSAAVISPRSLSVQSYDKRVLVPFGERVPYQAVFGFLENLNLGMANWRAGDRATVFETPAGKFSAAVCFESAFPDLMRRFVRDGADFLVILTNDAWFANTSLIYQHAEYASFRAIENRVWIARDANTGISCLIDPWGRQVQKAGAFEQKTIVGSIGKRESDTLYLHLGDWLAQLCLLAGVVLLAGGWVKSRRQSTQA
jgi:apolipoprotein N-acyltransferase